MRNRLLAVAIILFFFAAGAAHTAFGAVVLYVDDTLVEWDSPAFLVSGSVMVPITVVEQYLGARLEWSPGDMHAEVTFDEVQLRIEAGIARTLVNGQSTIMEPRARMEQGFLMVPLRYLVNHLGMRMTFDADVGGLRVTRTDAQRALGEARAMPKPSVAEEPVEERVEETIAAAPSLDRAGEAAEPTDVDVDADADADEDLVADEAEELPAPRRIVSLLERPPTSESTADDSVGSGDDLEAAAELTVEPLPRRIVSLLERPAPKFDIVPMDAESEPEEPTRSFEPPSASELRDQLSADGIARILPGIPDEEDAGPQDLQAIHYKGGPRSNVQIDVENFSRYQSVLLVEPDRLVIDLHGIEGDGLPEQVIDGPLIQRIRTSRFDDQTIRIVFDLHTSTGYEVRHWPDGGLEVEFNYHITDVYLVRDGLDDQPRLHIAASGNPDYTVIQLVEPRRMVLDFHNATLVGGAQEVVVDDGSVERLRVSQFIPSTTRIVLDLKSDVTPLAMTAADDEYVLSLFEGSQTEARIYQARVARETLTAQDYDETRLDYSSHAPRSVRREGAALSGYLVVVDPGHGGSDPGAIGPRGTFEKDVVLDISLYLGALLEDAGAEVVYTRRTDTYVSIFERPQIAIQARADLLVSVHVNSYIGNSARGTETLYHPKDVRNQMLAKALQQELVRAIELVDRGLRRRTDLAILNHSHIPSALVEVGFLNHSEEELLLRSSGFQQVAAEGIFNGVVHYLESLQR